MSDDEVAEAAAEMLKERGFDAALIPAGDSPRPDIRASADGIDYLLEVKAKSFDGARDADVVTEDYYARRDPLLRSNRLSGVTRKAAGQMEEAPEHADLRLMWMFLEGAHQSLLYKRLRYTLYGLRVVSVVGGLDDGALRECYFADYAEFISQRSALDGVVVGSLQLLLLNPYSEHAEMLKESRIARCVGAVEDPRRNVREKRCFLVEGLLERPTKEAVEAALRDQLGADRVELQHLVGYSAVSRTGPE